jgi:hypothetical protein
MKTIAELIKELQKYPEDANTYVYEYVIVIIDSNKKKELGMIECSEDWGNE